MRRSCTIGIVATLALLAGLAVAAAAGAAPALELEVQGRPLAPGAPLEASSSDFELYNEYWSLTCTQAVWGARLEVNGEGKGDSAVIDSGEFGGGQKDEAGCTSKYEFVAFWEPQETVELTFDAKGLARLAHPRWKLEPIKDIGVKGSHPAFSCVIDKKGAATAKGTFAVGSAPQQLSVSFEEHMALAPDYGRECTEAAHGHAVFMRATFAFTSEGVPVEVVRVG